MEHIEPSADTLEIIKTNHHQTVPDECKHDHMVSSMWKQQSRNMLVIPKTKIHVQNRMSWPAFGQIGKVTVKRRHVYLQTDTPSQATESS